MKRKPLERGTPPRKIETGIRLPQFVGVTVLFSANRDVLVATGPPTG